MKLVTISCALLGCGMSLHPNPRFAASRPQSCDVGVRASEAVQLGAFKNGLSDLQLGDTAHVPRDASGTLQMAEEIVVQEHVVDTASRTRDHRLQLANPNQLRSAGIRYIVNMDGGGN